MTGIDLLLSYYFAVAWYIFNHGSFWERYFTSLAAYLIGMHLTWIDQFWRGMLYWQFSLVSAMYDEPTTMIMLLPEVIRIFNLLDIFNH